MCVPEGCLSPHQIQSTTYRYVVSSRLPCHGRIYPLHRPPTSLRGVAEAPPFFERRRTRACLKRYRRTRINIKQRTKEKQQ
jgi:hypothetical protein